MEWNISRLLGDSQRDESIPLALIILNQPLCPLKTFDRLWSRASLKLFADGGSNRVYDVLEIDNVRRKYVFASLESDLALMTNVSRYLPDAIVGDLDSLRPDVRDWYAAEGVIAQKVQDQDSTDFQKCLALYEIVALGALSGRFDHVMHAINVLHQSQVGRRLYLLSDEGVVFLLTPGKHVIICDPNIEGPTCGLLPIGIAVAKLTTTGLKWNLDPTMPTSFGGLVSTSNAFADESDGHEKVVTVDTDQPIVWTCEVRLPRR
ncbi:thiamine diphosphokinase [Synchytrium microbalum]|uniref:Thiamine pyrophosphokinase n=1 Tax=Synchytrium microbalum TaxID=1806994 RepID=A0A507C3P1_9FUNG|nr:thiamine diphosphokinase [Synchytrium microbalum]TPX34091.1 thiamine diphosphokinase [Synchytrium microbalum]